jgi:hypothetical protein
LIDRVVAAAKERDEKSDQRLQARVRALEEAVRARVAGLKRLEGR